MQITFFHPPIIILNKIKKFLSFTFPFSQPNTHERKLRLCLVTVFVFYFQKLVFENIKKINKKNIFLVFLKSKTFLLVEIKKKKFFEGKNRMLKYVITRI